MENIHPIFDQILSRAEKEKLLGQKGAVIWLTGLSGSGKSAIATSLERELYAKGYLTKLLDGDNIRTGINSNLSFSPEDRQENIRRIAEVAKLFLQCGVICICSFVSPTNFIRQQARDIIGPEDFLEIFADAPLEVCEKRDVKGLYKKARAGEIKQFTGIDAPYEAPVQPFMILKTAENSLEACVQELLEKVLLQVKGNH